MRKATGCNKERESVASEKLVVVVSEKEICWPPMNMTDEKIR